MTLEQLDTPALIVDMDLVDANLQRLFGALDKTHVTVRPHLKTVKSPFFRQADAGIWCKGCLRR